MPSSVTSGLPHMACQSLTRIVIDGGAGEGACGGVAVGHGPSKIGQAETDDLAVVIQLIAILAGKGTA